MKIKVGDRVKILKGLGGGAPGKVGWIGEVSKCETLGVRVGFPDGQDWLFDISWVEPVTGIDWQARAVKAETRLEAMREATETYLRGHPATRSHYYPSDAIGVLQELMKVGGFTIKPQVIHPAPAIEPLCVLDQAA